MTTIWKFPLQAPRFGFRDLRTAFMPPGAVIVRMGLQDGALYLWAIVDPNELSREPRQFKVIATGDPIPELARYQGTYDEGALFMWHVFELP